MRLLAAAAVAAALLSSTACGSEGATPQADPASSSTPSATDGMSGMDMGDPDADATTSAPASGSADAVASTLKDAEAYAVQLEQTFFRNSYPKTLAGAIKAADKLDLSLSAGDTIAGYVYDPQHIEFRLCVENTSGAWATYDTRPMAMRESGKSGGCP